MKRRGPQQPVALGDAWRLIGRGRPRFPTTPRQLHDLSKERPRARLTFFAFTSHFSQIPFLALLRVASEILQICFDPAPSASHGASLDSGRGMVLARSGSSERVG